MDTVYCTQCGQLNISTNNNCLYCNTPLPIFAPQKENTPEARPRPYFANDPEGQATPEAYLPESKLPYAPTQQEIPVQDPWGYPGANPEPGYYAPQPVPAYPIPVAYPPGQQGLDAFGMPSYSAYAPPQKNQLEKADRGTRFIAALLDGFASLPFLGVAFALWAVFLSPFDRPDEPGSELILYLFVFLSMIPYWLIQGYLLTVNGQSLGKKAMGIRIVKESSGQNEGFMPNVLLRWIVPTLINMACGIFSLVDVLFIFGDEQKCLHDMMAGTIVVNNSPDSFKLN